MTSAEQRGHSAHESIHCYENNATSIYLARGRSLQGFPDPSTCFTATIETVDDDRASSLLGVLPPS